MVKRKIPESIKKRVAGRQRYTCATISNYTCPLNKMPFDESGYEIDHIKELRHGGTNDISNLQALCPSCHRVKTLRNYTKEEPQAIPCIERKSLLKHIYNNVLMAGRIMRIVSQPKDDDPN